MHGINVFMCLLVGIPILKFDFPPFIVVIEVHCPTSR
jgi:hypothetical protein